MNTQHTPGPWTVESLDNVDFTVLGGKSGQVRIAVETSERDARLIAAAPDLLAALRDVVLCADARGDAEPLDAYQTRAAMLPQQIARARAAIARATRCDA